MKKIITSTYIILLFASCKNQTDIKTIKLHEEFINSSTTKTTNIKFIDKCEILGGSLSVYSYNADTIYIAAGNISGFPVSIHVKTQK